MNPDVTLNANGKIDISPIDENAYRFILMLQSLPSVVEVWELFLKVVGRAYPGDLKEAELAYNAGVFNKALSARPSAGCKNKKKIAPAALASSGASAASMESAINLPSLVLREIDIKDYPFVETGATDINEMGYRCSDKEIFIFTRTEKHFIQVKMIFRTPSPFSLFIDAPLSNLSQTEGSNLSSLSRIFLNQMGLLLRMENLEFHSIKDDLTSAYNQKYLRGFIQHEIDRCSRYPSFFSVVFFDLDNLKNINDQYGHLIGTEVLKEVAYILSHQVRKIDLLSRFGGDEFVIVLLKASPQKAYETCCRIKKSLESAIFLKNKNLNITMTGCFGISSFPRDGSTVEELIKKADSAMYDVKRRGKNDIKIYKGV